MVRGTGSDKIAMASGKRNDAIIWAKRTALDWLLALCSITAALLIWQFVANAGLVSPLLFPPPTAVFRAFVGWWYSGAFLTDVEASFGRVFAGLAIGAVSGMAVGLITGRSAIFRRTLTPIFQVLRPLPPVAIIPLVIIWLGIGEPAKVFSIAFGVFFPVWLNTHVGAANVAVEHLRSAKIFSTSRWRTLTRVIIPAAFPTIFAGLRVAVAIAFVMVYVAEFAGASAGIGYEISITYLGYRIDQMMAALAVLALAGALTDALLSLAVKLAFPWMSAQEVK